MVDVFQGSRFLAPLCFETFSWVAKREQTLATRIMAGLLEDPPTP